MTNALSPQKFEAWLRREGSQRYHDRHPFHLRMHAGQLSPAEHVEFYRHGPVRRPATAGPR